MFKLLCHKLFTILATIYYGFPSRRLIVIGITGTKGKSSSALFIYKALQASGHNTGLISGICFKIGTKEIPNSTGNTMPGRGKIQKLMFSMVKQKCKFVVIEVTSHGINQFRCWGIFFDIVVFTNLSREHLELHENSYKKYRETKLKIFKGSFINTQKQINKQKIKKYIIVNNDEEDTKYFAKKQDNIKVLTFGESPSSDFLIKTDREGNFFINETRYSPKAIGVFVKFNIAPAHIIASIYSNGINQNIVKGIENTQIPGRMEEIKSHNINFRIFIDFAHEERSLTASIKTCKNLITNGRVIALVGGVGGGRDDRNIEITGKIAGQLADIVIVTNVDPWGINEKILANRVFSAVQKQGKIENKDLFIIIDRREAVKKAISIAKSGDIIILTGKGDERTMKMQDNSIEKYNDRVVVENILDKNFSNI